MRNGVALCSDILNAIDRIDEHLGSGTLPHFKTAHKTQDAIVYRLMVIGEAAGDLLDDHLDAASSVSTNDYDLPAVLKGFKRMRDKLIHVHWSVDAVIVLETVTTDLPNLKDFVQRLRLILACS